ncbi:hypothetical protein ISTM_12 [Insectomime virus]|uniref:Uncharacterized protein n=1 Tax=Tunisvirus fontaine2 TaxID=1421067 RepID=V9SGY1_9VIRU|nr:hypothetical protein D1R32_gp315 [Tunisvirus fontaine2]AHA45910.1 hypothetical protein ISTM_12 [Insectomime virus]AHC55032.1 hypothetical protein TNS_ORF314 [Tunisvirus fontaine2]
MQCDTMDHYSYGLCSLGKRKSENVEVCPNKKTVTKKVVFDARVANTSQQQTKQMREILLQRLAHIEEAERLLEEQLEMKERQAKALEEEKLLQEFLVACEMSGVSPDERAVKRFGEARRKFVVAKRHQ